MGKYTRVALLVAAISACSDGEPADVEGEFNLSLTNRENGCEFMDWTEGETSSGVPLTITQDGSDVSADVGGLARVVLDLALGGHVFEGEIDGSNLFLEIEGSRALSSGSCAYTLNAELMAEIDGDVLEGVIVYTAATNDSSDCGDLEGCETRQDFNGTRPPTGD